MKKLSFLLVTFLLPLSLLAQITIVEEKAVEKKPDWDYLKDAILAPYDSSYLHIQLYPLLDAYKKYVGQQLFFIDNVKRGFSLLYDKYFEIIDVISFKEAMDKSIFDTDNNYAKSHTFFYDKENGYQTGRFDIKEDNIPCFVLKDIQTNETRHYLLSGGSDELYRQSAYTNRYGTTDAFCILVGGYVKLKEETVGQHFVYVRHFYKHHKGEGRFSFEREIISEWKCIDVSICKNNFFNFDESKSKEEFVNYSERDIAFVLQNTKDTSIVRNLSIYDCCKSMKNCLIGIILKRTYQQDQQEKDKHKQQLTTKYGETVANQIIAGKYVIGMSKAACKEIGSGAVIDKTATTETWKISGFFTGGTTTYLYFTGDKLARIVKL